jgi:hypothetical protein
MNGSRKRSRSLRPLATPFSTPLFWQVRYQTTCSAMFIRPPPLVKRAKADLPELQPLHQRHTPAVASIWSDDMSCRGEYGAQARSGHFGLTWQQHLPFGQKLFCRRYLYLRLVAAFFPDRTLAKWAISPCRSLRPAGQIPTNIDFQKFYVLAYMLL